MKETKCPEKIERMDRIHRELLDRLLHDDGTMISPRYGLIKERHRPLSVKQVAWIMIAIFGCYISTFTLYRYMNFLEEKERNEQEERLSSNHT